LRLKEVETQLVRFKSFKKLSDEEKTRVIVEVALRLIGRRLQPAVLRLRVDETEATVDRVNKHLKILLPKELRTREAILDELKVLAYLDYSLPGAQTLGLAEIFGFTTGEDGELNRDVKRYIDEGNMRQRQDLLIKQLHEELRTRLSKLRIMLSLDEASWLTEYLISGYTRRPGQPKHPRIDRALKLLEDARKVRDAIIKEEIEVYHPERKIGEYREKFLTGGYQGFEGYRRCARELFDGDMQKAYIVASAALTEEKFEKLGWGGYELLIIALDEARGKQGLGSGLIGARFLANKRTEMDREFGKNLASFGEGFLKHLPEEHYIEGDRPTEADRPEPRTFLGIRVSLSTAIRAAVAFLGIALFVVSFRRWTKRGKRSVGSNITDNSDNDDNEERGQRPGKPNVVDEGPQAPSGEAVDSHAGPTPSRLSRALWGVGRALMLVGNYLPHILLSALVFSGSDVLGIRGFLGIDAIDWSSLSLSLDAIKSMAFWATIKNITSNMALIGLTLGIIIGVWRLGYHGILKLAELIRNKILAPKTTSSQGLFRRILRVLRRIYNWFEYEIIQFYNNIFRALKAVSLIGFVYFFVKIVCGGAFKDLTLPSLGNVISGGNWALIGIFAIPAVLFLLKVMSVESPIRGPRQDKKEKKIPRIDLKGLFKKIFTPKTPKLFVISAMVAFAGGFLYSWLGGPLVSIAIQAVLYGVIFYKFAHTMVELLKSVIGLPAPLLGIFSNNGYRTPPRDFGDRVFNLKQNLINAKDNLRVWFFKALSETILVGFVTLIYAFFTTNLAASLGLFAATATFIFWFINRSIVDLHVGQVVTAMRLIFRNPLAVSVIGVINVVGVGYLLSTQGFDGLGLNTFLASGAFVAAGLVGWLLGKAIKPEMQEDIVMKKTRTITKDDKTMVLLNSYLSRVDQVFGNDIGTFHRSFLNIFDRDGSGNIDPKDNAILVFACDLDDVNGRLARQTKIEAILDLQMLVGKDRAIFTGRNKLHELWKLHWNKWRGYQPVMNWVFFDTKLYFVYLGKESDWRMQMKKDRRSGEVFEHNPETASLGEDNSYRPDEDYISYIKLSKPSKEGREWVREQLNLTVGENRLEDITFKDNIFLVSIENDNPEVEIRRMRLTAGGALFDESGRLLVKGDKWIMDPEGGYLRDPLSGHRVRAEDGRLLPRVRVEFNIGLVAEEVNGTKNRTYFVIDPGTGEIFYEDTHRPFGHIGDIDNETGFERKYFFVEKSKKGFSEKPNQGQGFTEKEIRRRIGYDDTNEVDKKRHTFAIGEDGRLVPIDYARRIAKETVEPLVDRIVDPGNLSRDRYYVLNNVAWSSKRTRVIVRSSKANVDRDGNLVNPASGYIFARKGTWVQDEETGDYYVKGLTDSEKEIAYTQGYIGDISSLEIGKTGKEAVFFVGEDQLRDIQEDIRAKLKRVRGGYLANSGDGFFRTDEGELGYVTDRGQRVTFQNVTAERVNRVEVDVDDKDRKRLKKVTTIALNNTYYKDKNQQNRYRRRKFLAHSKEVYIDCEGQFRRKIDGSEIQPGTYLVDELGNLWYSAQSEDDEQLRFDSLTVDKETRDLVVIERLAKKMKDEARNPGEYQINRDGTATYIQENGQRRQTPLGTFYNLGGDYLLDENDNKVKQARRPRWMEQTDPEEENLREATKYKVSVARRRAKETPWPICSLYQIEIVIANSLENLGVHETGFAQTVLRYVARTNDWIYREASAWGKMLFDIASYTHNVIVKQAVPFIARCHDHWESLKSFARLLHGLPEEKRRVIIGNNPVTFYSFLARSQGWVPGDLFLLYADTVFGAVIKLFRGQVKGASAHLKEKNSLVRLATELIKSEDYETASGVIQRIGEDFNKVRPGARKYLSIIIAGLITPHAFVGWLIILGIAAMAIPGFQTAALAFLSLLLLTAIMTVMLPISKAVINLLENIFRPNQRWYKTLGKLLTLEAGIVAGLFLGYFLASIWAPFIGEFLPANLFNYFGENTPQWYVWAFFKGGINYVLPYTLAFIMTMGGPRWFLRMLYRVLDRLNINNGRLRDILVDIIDKFSINRLALSLTGWMVGETITSTGKLMAWPFFMVEPEARVGLEASYSSRKVPWKAAGIVESEVEDELKIVPGFWARLWEAYFGRPRYRYKGYNRLVRLPVSIILIGGLILWIASPFIPWLSQFSPGIGLFPLIPIALYGVLMSEPSVLTLKSPWWLLWRPWLFALAITSSVIFFGLDTALLWKGAPIIIWSWMFCSALAVWTTSSGTSPHFKSDLFLQRIDAFKRRKVQMKEANGIVSDEQVVKEIGELTFHELSPNDEPLMDERERLILYIRHLTDLDLGRADERLREEINRQISIRSFELRERYREYDWDTLSELTRVEILKRLYGNKSMRGLLPQHIVNNMNLLKALEKIITRMHKERWHVLDTQDMNLLKVRGEFVGSVLEDFGIPYDQRARVAELCYLATMFADPNKGPTGGKDPGRLGKGWSGGPALPGSMNVEFLAKIIEGIKGLVKVVGRSIRLFEKERDVSRATEINITLQKMLIKLIEKGKIDLKGKTFDQLTEKDIRRLETQVAELIMFHREVGDWVISELFDERVSGELFPLREAKENPEYLKVSRDYDYREWVKGIAWRTLREIYRVKGEPLDEELVDTVTNDVINALEFRLANGKRISEMIANQMVRELTEHILGVLLEGEPEFIFYTYRKLKKVGCKVALAILEKEKDLDLLDELKRSIFAGLIGVEMKTPVTGTTKLVKTNAIQLDLEKPINQNVSTVKKQFAEMMKKDLAINFWREYEEEILESLRPVSMVFFTDDYIETIFDLKFIERQLEHNEYLTVHLVPRAHYYANDASYEDIMELMGEEVFKDLRRFHEEGRFTVCREGPRMSTFYKETISRQVAELLRQSDVVVGKGARAYETMQGIKKPGYFSMAVCREFTEAITGVDERSGAPVFIRHDPGVPSFTDFRYRADRAHIFEDGKVSGLARMTATDYARAVRSDAYSRLLETFGNDRNKANRWIMKNTFRHGTTFAEEVFRGRLPIMRKELPGVRAISWLLIGAGLTLVLVGIVLYGTLFAILGAGLRVVPWVYRFIKWLVPSRMAPEVEPELVRHAKEALFELATTLQPDSLKKIFGIENMTKMPASAKNIEGKLTKEIEKPLRKFLRALALLAKRPLSKEDRDNIELTLEHIVGDLTSLLQIYNAKYTKEPSRQVRLERLSEFDVSKGKGGKPGVRTKANLKLLREIYRNGDLFKWVITILLHDIGRFEEFYDPTATVHEKVSFDLITRFNVLKELNDSLERPLSVEAISIIPLIVRYHMFFRGPCEGGFSFIKIGQMLSDPYLQTVLSDEKGKIDKEKLKAFLEDLALFSVFDISGTKGKGRASNPRVEYFVGMVQEIGKIAEDAGYDWDRVSALAKERASRYLNLRICGFLSFRDMNQKNISPPEPLGSLPRTECYKFYFKKFFESLNHLLRSDKLSKKWFTNWGRIRPWFVRNFSALTFRYLNYLVGHLAWIEEGVDFDRMSDEEIRKYFEREYKVEEDYKVNPNTIKLFLLLTRTARHENFGIQCEETIIGGENGERIDFKEDFHDYVIALNKILTQARDVNLYIDGNIYFVDEKQENIDGAVMVKETAADGTHRLILKISKSKAREPEKITLPERPLTVGETIRAVKAKLKEKGWEVPETFVEEILTVHTHPKPRVVPNEKKIERLAEQVFILYLMLKYFKKTPKKERPARLVLVQNVYEKEGEELSRGGAEDITEIKIVTIDRMGLFGDEAKKIADFGGFIRSNWSYTEEINGESLIALVFEIHKPFHPDKETEGGRFDVDFVANKYKSDENTLVLTVRRDRQGRPILIPFTERPSKRAPEKAPAKKPWYERYADKVSLDKKESIIDAVLVGLGPEEDGYMPEGIYGDFLRYVVKIVITRHLGSHLGREEEEEKEKEEKEKEKQKGLNIAYVLKRVGMQCLYAFVSLLISFQANRDRKDKLIYFLLYTPFMNLLSELKEKGITGNIMDHNEIIVIVPSQGRIINAKIDTAIREVIGKYNGIAMEPWIAPVSLPENIAGKDQQRNFVIRGYEIIRQSKELPEGTPKGTRRLVGKEIDNLRKALSKIKVDNLSMRSVTREKLDKLLEKGKRGEWSSTRRWGGIFEFGFGLGLWVILACAVTVIGARAIYQQVSLAGSGLVEVEQVRLPQVLGLEAVWQALKSLFEGGWSVVAAIFRQSSKRAELGKRWNWPQRVLPEEEALRIMQRANELNQGRGIARVWVKGRPHLVNPAANPWLIWRSPHEEMGREITEIGEFAKSVMEEYENVVVIGRAEPFTKVAAAIREKVGYPQVYALESAHPEAIKEIEGKINLEKTLFVVSSPAPGEAYEAYEHFYKKLTKFYEALGVSVEEIAYRVGEHFVGIVEPNTPFAEEARKKKFLKVFTEETGVAHSIFSYEGLVPLALAGVDIERFVESGKMGKVMCGKEKLEENPGVQLALSLKEMMEAGREIVLVLPERLRGFGELLQEQTSRLWGESGKIIPVAEEELSSLESYGENAAFMGIKVGAKESLAIRELKKAGHPVFELPGKEAMGALFYIAEFGTAFSYLMGIEGFRKPGSEQKLSPAEPVSYGLEKMSPAQAGLETMGEPFSEYQFGPEAFEGKVTNVVAVDLSTLLEMELDEEPTHSMMRRKLRVSLKSIGALKVMKNIIDAAKEEGSLHRVKFAFVSSEKGVTKEVMERMLRDHMSACGLSTEDVSRIINKKLIIDQETLKKAGGIVGISRTKKKISAEAVFSIITERLLGRTDGNGIKVSIVTDSEDRWQKARQREIMEKMLWVVLNPAEKGEILSTAEGLVVAIEGKVSKWLRKFIEKKYPGKAEELLPQIKRDGMIILPAAPVDEEHLKKIKAQETVYEIQA